MEILTPPEVKEKRPPGRRSKHTEAFQMMVAKQVVGEGMPYREAGTKFGLSHGSISNIIKKYHAGKLKEQRKEAKSRYAKEADGYRHQKAINDLKVEIADLFLENLMLKKMLEYSRRKEKREFIRHYLREFGSITRACKMTGISRATFYNESIKDAKQLSRDLELRDQIEEIHSELPGYGYRRIREHLKREGKIVNGKRIQRVMKKYNLFSCLKKMFKPRGGRLEIRLVYPNLLRGKKLTGPNQVWATDITFIKLMAEYVYLSAVIDVYTRKIVGWAVSRDLSHKFCLKSLDIAVKRYKPQKGIVHHSDRGVQYCCEDYVKYLLDSGFDISMSRTATPEDNAYIESFFKTLKREEIYFKDYKVFGDIKDNLPRFIEEVYNTKRLHSSLGYKPPSEFECEILKLKPADRPVQKLWGYSV